MEISEREMQSMAKAELAEMTIFSLCANTRFSKLICPHSAESRESMKAFSVWRAMRSR